MSFKLFTTIYNANRISEQTIVEKLLQSQRNLINKAILEQENIVPLQLPSIYGSWFVEITRAHPSGIQMIFQNCVEDGAHSLLQWDQIAFVLSKEIPDEPFITISYSSVVDTGGCDVYMNGELIESSPSTVGDYGMDMNPILQKYFPIKRDVFPILQEWASNNILYNDYSISSYVAMKRVNDKGPTEDNYMYDWCSSEMKAIELFKSNPKMTKEEWKENKDRDKEYGYDMCKHAYQLYLYHTNKAYGTNLYALTEGHLYDKNGAWLLEKPVKVEPLTWFDLRDKAKKDLQQRKDEVYGQAPPSYTLTKDELEQLSYEEQKIEAFKRFTLAKKRGENIGRYFGNYYTKGIIIQSPFEIGQYILYKDEYLYIKDIRLAEHKHNQTFIEEILAIKYIHEKNEIQYRNIDAGSFSNVVAVEKHNVPEVFIVSEQYKLKK